jgi:hypothetical protein
MCSLVIATRDFADICGKFECTRVTNVQGSNGKRRQDTVERDAKCTVIDDQFAYVSLSRSLPRLLGTSFSALLVALCAALQLTRAVGASVA